MNYIIEELNINNVEAYARIDVLAWKQSYKGIIDDDYLELINTEDEIQKFINKLKNNLNNKSNNAFILKVDNKYGGILRIRKSKYDNYSDCGELGALYLLESIKGKGFGRILFEKAIKEFKNMGYNKMVNGCLESNPSNMFYKHMGGKYIEQNPILLPNGQELIENIYLYKI